MSNELFDCRLAFAETLTELARQDRDLCVVVNDSVGSAKLGDFKKELPDQMVNVGIAEQNMVGIAAGLENSGKVPFVSSAGCFLSARAMEQIKVDVAYSNRHVVLCAQSPGVGYGQLGATHHSIEDVPWMRTIPNMTVIVPADPIETAQALKWAYDHDGPVYIRISRSKVPAVHRDSHIFQIGKATELRSGRDLSIVTNGTVLHRALKAAEVLAADGIEAQILSMASVKPLDVEAILAAARDTKHILTVEEGLTNGGLGSAVAELLAREVPTKVHSLGFPDTFMPTGSAEWLLDHFGMSPEGIARAAHELIGK